MKRVFMIHGWQGYPQEGWRPWLKKKLEKRGFEVIVPMMPDTNNPKMDAWVDYLSKIVGNPDKDCYFIGHSLGCITILRYLESLKKEQRIGGVILVAGFSYDLEYAGYQSEVSSFFETPLRWDKLRRKCHKFIAIHSDNDPWVPLKHKDVFAENLGAKIMVMHDMKHFSGDDGITELLIVLEKILEMSS